MTNRLTSRMNSSGAAFRETENGFEAQQCYVDEIRQVEGLYRRPKQAARDQLRDDIDKALMQSKDFDEFLKRLERLKYEVRPENISRFVRSSVQTSSG